MEAFFFSRSTVVLMWQNMFFSCSKSTVVLFAEANMCFHKQLICACRTSINFLFSRSTFCRSKSVLPLKKNEKSPFYSRERSGWFALPPDLYFGSPYPLNNPKPDKRPPWVVCHNLQLMWRWSMVVLTCGWGHED